MPERHLIPVYDDASIACTIADAEIPGRIKLIQRLRAATLTIDRTSAGLLLRFPDDPTVRADLQTFVVDEKRCCQFWDFAVSEEPDGVALRWDGPPAVDDLLGQLHTFFTTDAPIDILVGLL